MRKRDLDKLEEILLKRKQNILDGAIDPRNGDLKSDREELTDSGDVAAAEVSRSFKIRLREREEKLLKKIDGALGRIKDGTYGICDDCGEPIEVKRLKARPVTTFCIDCKSKQEEEEAQE